MSGFIILARRGRFLQNSFVVIVHRNRQGLLRMVLTDAMKIELTLDFSRFGDT